MQTKPFRYYLKVALLLHIIAMIIMAASLNFRNNIIPQEQVITVDIVPVKSITNVKTVRKEFDKPVINEKAKSVQSSSSPQQIQKEKTEDKKQENKDIKKTLDTKVVKPKDDKPKDKAKDKVKSKTQENQKQEKQNNKQSESKIKQNMQTIEKSSKGTEQQSKNQNREKQDPDIFEALGKDETDDEISIDDEQLIKGTIEKNWDLGFVLGVRNIDKVSIIVMIAFSYDGSLSEDPIVTQRSCPEIANSVCDAVVRTITTAIIKSSPIIGLNIDRYESWKRREYVFTPDL